MEYRYRVYCHTNKENGKKYIGMTMFEPNKRWLDGKGYKANKPFYSDIEQYGWDTFEHEVLYDNLTKEDAEKLERNLIKKFNTTVETSGYNLDNGGSGPGRMSEHNRNRMKQKKKPDGYKTRQISLSFKDTDREIEIYNWLNTKYSKGAFIKDLLLQVMDNEKRLNGGK